MISRIERMFYKFIWNDKNDRIKRTKLNQPLELDGPNMIHLQGFVKSMKIFWMQRVYKSKHTWLQILQPSIPFLEDLRTYWSTKLRLVSSNIHNQFWKNALEAWTEFFELFSPDSDQIITEAIWFSDISKFSSSIIKYLDSKGIRYVADLIKQHNGNFVF